MKEAMYGLKAQENRVRCQLCPHRCTIDPGEMGICRARKNVDGTLYSMNYGYIASLSLDPIEKKPLKRFRSGSLILSAGTYGCNLKCAFCQNWSIAHSTPETVECTPAGLVDQALKLLPQGNIGIAYTYNEPSIWYEFVLETARLAKEKGLCNVLVTNGFIEPEPLRQLIPYLDAMNIDVKAFTPEFYLRVCKGSLEAVRKTVEFAVSRCHVEITTLIIPGMNDSMEEIDRLAAWLASLSQDIPLHLTRFFPNYRMSDLTPTPVSILQEAEKVASRHLRYVYLGNV